MSSRRAGQGDDNNKKASKGFTSDAGAQAPGQSTGQKGRTASKGGAGSSDDADGSQTPPWGESESPGSGGAAGGCLSIITTLLLALIVALIALP